MAENVPQDRPHGHGASDPDCACFEEGYRVGLQVGEQFGRDEVREQYPDLFDEDGKLVVDDRRLN